MIIYDCEADGLLGPTALPLDQQPKILEVGILILEEKKSAKGYGKGPLVVKEEFSTFVNPGRPIPAKVTEITGITDAMVKGAPSFSRIYPKLVELFFGQGEFVAHNVPYDRGVLAGELQRIGKLLEFPWPPKHICTAETTEHLEGKYLKQDALWERIMGRPANQTHRALDDVKQLLDIVQWCRKEKLL